jgi:hypothetical protein
MTLTLRQKWIPAVVYAQKRLTEVLTINRLKSDLHISTEILLKEAKNAIALHQTPILVMLLFRF